MTKTFMTRMVSPPKSTAVVFPKFQNLIPKESVDRRLGGPVTVGRGRSPLLQ